MQLTGAFKLNLTDEIAQQITAGIITDTGNLNYVNNPKTTEESVFNDLTQLSKVTNIGKVTKKVNSMEFNDFELTREFLNRVKFTDNKKIGYFIMDKELIQKCKNEKKCIENAIINTMNQISRIRGVKYYFVLREQPKEFNKVTVILHSNNGPVNTIAEQFGGGGHAQACGFTTNVENTNEFINDLINKLNELKKVR
jgi:nanoRNase/pAp phosphatase (c-di-AMP/oligoRNAs hydrolase)